MVLVYKTSLVWEGQNTKRPTSPAFQVVQMVVNMYHGGPDACHLAKLVMLQSMFWAVHSKRKQYKKLTVHWIILPKCFLAPLCFHKFHRLEVAFGEAVLSPPEVPSAELSKSKLRAIRARSSKSLTQEHPHGHESSSRLGGSREGHHGDLVTRETVSGYDIGTINQPIEVCQDYQ